MAITEDKVSITGNETNPAQWAKYNQDVKNWAKSVRQQLAASARSKTTKGKKATKTTVHKDEGEITEKILASDIRSSVKISYGTIEKCSFSFPRHGVFWQKGVSKGHKISNPRKAVDWFNSIIEQNVPLLENIVAEYYADAVVNASQVLIK